MCHDFQALHHFLQVEEVAMLDQLRRDQMELEHSLERHLEALHTAIREPEQRVGSLQMTTSTVGNIAVCCVVEVLVLQT